MKKQENQEFDYLQSLVSEQIQEIRNFGPIAYEIFDALMPPAGTMNIENLVRKLMELDKMILKVDADGLNLRARPGISSPVIKVLSRSTQLIALDSDSDRKIGVQGQWLHVLDIAGDQGYVVAQFVSKIDTTRDPREKIDHTMHTLEYFGKMELVQIDKQGDRFDVTLTQKGRYLADFLVESNEGRFNDERFFKKSS
jgi:hypothetical protein